MKILFCSSEVVPFAKTGGLADVVGALPKKLRELGHEVVVFMPAYAAVHHVEQPITTTGIEFNIPLGAELVSGRLLRGQLPDSDAVIFFVENSDYFDRRQLYGENGQDYADNCERFVFFCRAVLESIRLLDWCPDLIHANDWQTGLIPALLKTEVEATPFYENIASLLTIHNLAYQGSFWHWDMLLTGIDWKHFNWKEMECFGRLNLLKTGIVFADAINTVSPTYALEIQTAEHGCGLDGVLRHRSNVLSGILNGIDDEEWDPAKDSMIVVNYDANSWQSGKLACKTALQRERGLKVDPAAPMIGIVGRLASQKGWSLIVEVMEKWLAKTEVQWVVLGTGQPEYHTSLSNLARQYPDKLGLELGFSNRLAHQIESAADLFLMPSQYEPCGLNQMYSLTYGTVPVVRATGGLADTVVDATEEAIQNRTANGFCFENFVAEELDVALTRAVGMYLGYPEIWQQIVLTGMKQDWSWATSAKQYARLYEQTIARKCAAERTLR